MVRAASLTYRPDIDGLRAVAVLSVLCYHVGFTAFGAGYLGVDVFFVISGYLITGLIVEQVERGTFTLKHFYLRRARRLLPALLAVTIVSIAAAVIILPPVLLAEFGGSVAASSLSLSNVYFFRLTDYFDTSSINKPLLHTWSLSVEEQFYLFWPVSLMVALRRFGRKGAGVALLLFGIASAAAMELALAKASAVFYLVPFRGFEFVFGGVLVWLPSAVKASNAVREVATAAGLALIAVAVLGYIPARLSDVRILLACAGAALVIFGGEARVTGAVLRHPVMVAIGAISYSLYLVHWPIVVFLKYRTLEDFTLVDRWLLVAYSFAAAVLVYRLIETPFRHRHDATSGQSDRRFVLGYVASLAVVVGLSVHMWRTGGWLWRYPEAVQRQINVESLNAFKLYTHALAAQLERPFADDGREKVLIVGDSQAEDFVNLLEGSGRLPAWDLVTLKMSMQCQALIVPSQETFNRLSKEDRALCDPGYRACRDGDPFRRAEVVVLAFNWDERGVPVLDAATRRMHALGAHKVVVVGRKSQGLGGPDLVLRHGLSNIEAFSATQKNPIAWRSNAAIAALRSDFTYVDLMSKICPTPSRCTVFGEGDEMIFFDGSHFTPNGARYVARLLAATGDLDF